MGLEELKEESDSGRLSGATAAAAKPRRHALWLAALIGVIALGAVAYWDLRPTEQAVQPSMTAVPLTSYAGYEIYPSFSPDGNQVAFVWDGEKQDNLDIYVKLIGPGTPIRITSDPAEDYDPAWSPDGRWIAFVRRIGISSCVLSSDPSSDGLPPASDNSRLCHLGPVCRLRGRLVPKPLLRERKSCTPLPSTRSSQDM